MEDEPLKVRVILPRFCIKVNSIYLASKMKRIVLLCTILWVVDVARGQHVSRPFPAHNSYVNGAIVPYVGSQAAADKLVQSLYDSWKKRYVRNDCNDPSQFYVMTDEGDKHNGIPVVCVSEGQGFGMLIVPFMAGYDRDAQKIYDGMYRFVCAHPTAKSRYLMSWSILKGCREDHHKTGDEFDNTSATDGDLDIALSLFIADAQWGSSGAIKYREEGVKRVRAILEHEVNLKKHTLLLSDANDPGDYDYFDIRTSDFMPTHLRVFDKFFPNPEWKKIIDNTYQIFRDVQHRYSPKAGLIPDFITYRAKKYQPAAPNYLEAAYDGAYYYNACRIPLRIGSDYVLNGDLRAKELLNPLIDGLAKRSGGNFAKIYAGYHLNGRQIPKYEYVSLCFTSPAMVGAMVDPCHQRFLSRGWSFSEEIHFGEFHYYDSTIHLLSMLILTGNYWLP